MGVHILLVVEQSSLGSQSRGCAKTPILTVLRLMETKHLEIILGNEIGTVVMYIVLLLLLLRYLDTEYRTVYILFPHLIE